MKRLLPSVAGLLALAACHSQTQPATDTPAVATAPAATAAPTGAANSPSASYHTYRGLLPGQPDSITLHLVTARQPRYDAEGLSRYGSYYGADGHPYAVQSLSSAPDSVVLTDLSAEHSRAVKADSYKQPVWHLKQLAGGTLAGTGADGQPLRLRLVPTPAGGLTFAVRCFADSVMAFPKDPTKSSRGRINLQALVPVGGPAALAANLLRDLRGDTLGSLPVPTLPALYQQQRDAFYREYRTDVADTSGGMGPEQLPFRFNYDNQSATSVLFQQGNLLSLGFFTYSYTGGAHGADGITVASYDLRTGRRLRYDDIFLPTAKARLPVLLARAVHLALSSPPDVMPVTSNVFLTSGGAVFVYGPSEITIYAEGEVRVFVPLAQLRGLLRADLPLPGAAEIAAR